jgi:D-alanyl-D-alanine carboxypeptidase
MRADDVYPIGSTTKSYTAVLVMRLVEQGKIGLTDTVAEHLPGLLPDGARITVKELLSHTSGLPDFAEDPTVLAPYLRGELGFAWTPRQLVGFAAARPLLFPPGTRFSYSNTNYFVLALIAERADGRSYAAQLRDDIARPLGLTRTSLPADSRTLPDVHGYLSLRAYDAKADPAPFDSAALTPSFGWSAGGIRATADEVADFYRGLFTGRLLRPDEVAAMEDTAPTGGAYGLGLMPTGARAYEWGPDTQAINTTCGRAWGHGGSFPGYYQLPISSPDGARQAVLMVNTDTTRMTATELARVYDVLDTAYCRGVPSLK